MLALLALLPFILLLILMVVFEKPAFISAPITFLITLLITFYAWQMDFLWMIGSLIRSFSITLEIMLIIFGAIFLLLSLTATGAFKPIKRMFEAVSKDARIQAVIIGWFFVSFIEGIAGFGTPAMLAAPLLIALGFPVILSVVIALIGNSVSVTFGAVGIPVTIGIKEGIGESLGSSISIEAIGELASLIHLFLSPVIPLILILIVGAKLGSSLKNNLQLWPFALISGFAFTIPSYLTAKFIALEFPSIIGALIGGAFIILLLRMGMFQRKDCPSFKKIPDELCLPEDKSKVRDIIKSLSPYILIITLLLITRIQFFGITDKLQNISFSLPEILNLPGSHDFAILYSPGFVFIIAVIAGLLIKHINFSQFKNALNESLGKIKLPFVGLFFVIAIVQLMIFSGNNASGYLSMPMEIAGSLSGLGATWPAIAPFVGVLGSFISGSSTVSNLLFSSLQGTTAIATGVSVVLILSLQAVGSAVGNMIAIHNIIAAQSVVGLKDKESSILKATLPTALIYATLAGVVGLIFAFFI